MTRWPIVRLGELATLYGGGTPRRDRKDYWGGEIPWASVKDLQTQELHSTVETITVAGLENSATNLVPAETVIVASRVGLGKVVINSVPVAINQDLKAIVPIDDRLNPHYLKFFLVSKASYLAKAGVGATVKGLTIGDFQKLEMLLPPLSEQERIVKLLDEADALRKLRAQADHRSAQLIPALFHEMFGDPLTNSKGWDVRPVSSFVSQLYGGRSVEPVSADTTIKGLRVLKISAVTWGNFRPCESKPVSSKYEPPELHFVKPGDLLFSRANTTQLVGATSYVFETPPNLLLPDKIWRFVWREPRTTDPLFIWSLFQSDSLRRELAQRATGTGGSMKNISKPKVMSLEVAVPPLPRQQEFAKRVMELRDLEADQAASRRCLEDVFQSCLHSAFAGEP